MMLWRIACISVICFGLMGCVRLGAEANAKPEENFTLETNAAKIPHAVSSIKTIQVNLGQASVGFRTRKMAYQEKSQTLNYFALHQWLAPPVTLMTTSLSQALTETGHYKAVILAPNYGGLTDYQVSVQLYQLQQNVEGTRAEEVLRLQVVVIDTVKNSALASRMFSVTIPCDPNPTAGAKAANQALTELMPKMVQFILLHT